MNCIESQVRLALSVSHPLLAITIIDNSCLGRSERQMLFQMVLNKITTYSKKRIGVTIKALFELFWKFYQLSDLDKMIVCLKILANCDLANEESYKLEVASQICLLCIQNTLDISATSG